MSGVHGHGRPGADLPVPRGTPAVRVVQRPPPRLPAVRPRAHERAQQNRRGSRGKAAGSFDLILNYRPHDVNFNSLTENAGRRGYLSRLLALPLPRHIRVRTAEGSQVAPGQSYVPDQVRFGIFEMV